MSSSDGAAAEDRSPEDLVGSRIGQYCIEEEIGHGGMGIVYRAVHTEIGQLAAVKVLSARCAQNPRDLRRFLNEARAVSRIDHPGLVKIFDFGQTPAGIPYILMEYLRGELLKKRIERFRRARRTMSAGEALRIGRQTAAALSAAHDKGIVHRDLKPSNLMLVPDEEAPGGERAKLLDFGVARFVADPGDRTAPGVVVGTAAYMSPEQCTGMGDVDGRSDIYSLAVMLYEMIAGEPLFQGNFRDLLSQHLTQKPRPLGERVPGLPSEVGELMHRMLAKEPSRRPKVGEVIDELRRWEGEALSLWAVSATLVDGEESGRTSSSIRPTGRLTAAATSSEPFASSEDGPETRSSTHETVQTTTGQRPIGESTTESRTGPLWPPKDRPEALPPHLEIGQTTITVPPRSAFGEKAVPGELAPLEEKPSAERRASEPEAPLAPPKEEALPRPSRRRRHGLLRIGLFAALAVLVAAPLYRYVKERSPRKLEASQNGMIRLAGGTFRMGSTAAEIEAECERLGRECRRDWLERERPTRIVTIRDGLEREQPARMVTLSPFYLDVHETINTEFARWLNTITSALEIKEDADSHIGRFVRDHERRILLADLHNEHSGLIHLGDRHFEARKGYENKPVVQVTWDAASRYCQWQGKRLPTEAEWEFAARGLSSRRFPWGDAPPRCDGVVFGRKEGGPQCERLPIGVQDVGTFAQDRTPEGILDLGGNASEWVQDQFVPPSYPSCGACIDPKEERSVPADQDMRIQRGGAWSTMDAMSRGARRLPWERGKVTTGLGFRCASQ